MAPKFKCRLTRLTDNNHTRTKIIEGECDWLPEAGFHFVMTSKALDKSLPPDLAIRLIETSKVFYTSRSFSLDNEQLKINFTTENTSYLFELLEDFKDECEQA